MMTPEVGASVSGRGRGLQGASSRAAARASCVWAASCYCHWSCMGEFEIPGLFHAYAQLDRALGVEPDPTGEVGRGFLCPCRACYPAPCIIRAPHGAPLLLPPHNWHASNWGGIITVWVDVQSCGSQGHLTKVAPTHAITVA